MNGEDKKFLNERLIKLETLFKERWNNHDKRSEEIWKDIQGKIGAVFNKFSKLQCAVHITKIKNMESNILRLWTLVLIVVGSCVGGFWWMLRIK